jgi:hypothetical protein
LLAGPFREHRSIEPTQGDLRVGRSIPNGVENFISTLIVIHEDEALLTTNECEHVQIVHEPSPLVREFTAFAISAERETHLERESLAKIQVVFFGPA